MRLVVQTIHIPAWSTIGFGSGIDTGERVTFCGDHGPMHQLGEHLRISAGPIHAEVEDWQIFDRVENEAEERA